MVEAPFFQDVIAEKQQRTLLRMLERRFGSVPEELAGNLKEIFDVEPLDRLTDEAMDCADLDTFRARVVS